jgi:hypothetical protein
MATNLPQYDEEDDAKDEKCKKDFDCPSCSANNPYDDGIYPGDEVTCYYCGQVFNVEKGSDGRWKFREA